MIFFFLHSHQPNVDNIQIKICFQLNKKEIFFTFQFLYFIVLMYFLIKDYKRVCIHENIWLTLYFSKELPQNRIIIVGGHWHNYSFDINATLNCQGGAEAVSRHQVESKSHVQSGRCLRETPRQNTINSSLFVCDACLSQTICPVNIHLYALLVSFNHF